MSLALGCNAVSVTGCRIIASPRERLIAILTNAFIPCNGRLPALITITAVFFAAGAETPLLSALISGGMLTAVILAGIGMTLLCSRLLSQTLLRGEPSSFSLELPPYRAPKVGRVIARSLLDRTVFVLLRAVKVAAPAGAIIWLLANVSVGGETLLAHCAAFLDPFGRLMGLDGVILLAFILGFPANEIVLPLALMTYMQTGVLSEFSVPALAETLTANGWTWLTALCTMLFSLMHWPCGTTCLTIKKETGSLKWTLLSALLPTLCGILVCALVAAAARAFGLA